MSAVNVRENSRLADLINYRIKVFTIDGRVYIGELLGFDKYMNVILSDCVEERIPKTQQHKLKSKDKEVMNSIKVEKRVLGLTILRGETVLSTVVEDKPSTTKKERLQKEKQEEKMIKKQKNQNKKKQDSMANNNNNGNKVHKPAHNSRGNNSKINTDNLVGQNIPKPRKFQPPPGFKRR